MTGVCVSVPCDKTNKQALRNPIEIYIFLIYVICMKHYKRKYLTIAVWIMPSFHHFNSITFFLLQILYFISSISIYYKIMVYCLSSNSQRYFNFDWINTIRFVVPKYFIIITFTKFQVFRKSFAFKLLKSAINFFWWKNCWMN